MIGSGTGVPVYLACGVTDMRKGIFGLAAAAQQVLHQNPGSGAVFAFRGRRGDRLKLLYWDGQGFCLYYKVLEHGRFREAACWAHLRRAFHDVWKATGSPLAKQALDQIGALYDIERAITGQAAARRQEVRQIQSRPRAEAFRSWCEGRLARISGKSDLAKAMRYALRRWAAFILFVEDGRIAIDNNPAERAIRPIAIGRKNWLFAGADAGGETLADAMTLIETAKLAGLNPETHLADVLARINDHLITRLDELLPWNWIPASQQPAQAA